MTVLNGLLAAAEWILQTSIKSSVLIGLILLVQWVLRSKLSARWRYALWLLLLVRMLLPFNIESKLSIFNMVPQKEEPVVTAIQEEPRQIQSPHTADYRIPVSSAVQLSPIQNNQSQPGLSPEQILTIIWFLGACVMAPSTFIGNMRLWRQLKKYKPVTNKKIQKLFEQCKQDMHVKQYVELVRLKQIRVPALYGILKPKILLPDKVAASFKMDDLKNIFYHELAHLKRRDVLTAWITTILQICHWFNPAIWFAFFRIRMDRELACHISDPENHKHTAKPFSPCWIIYHQNTVFRSWWVFLRLKRT
jgi:beta-lactamase regulating signal transducer with metallopeptidase domain